MIEAYLADVEAALHVRGRVRRRIVRECRDHLVDAAAEHGEHAAVRAFGPAAEIAAAVDREVAARRGSTRPRPPSLRCWPRAARLSR